MLQSQGEALPSPSTWRPHVSSGCQSGGAQTLLLQRWPVAPAGRTHPLLPQICRAHSGSPSFTWLATLPSGDGEDSAPLRAPGFLLLRHLHRDPRLEGGAEGGAPRLHRTLPAGPDQHTLLFYFRIPIPRGSAVPSIKSVAFRFLPHAAEFLPFCLELLVVCACLKMRCSRSRGFLQCHRRFLFSCDSFLNGKGHEVLCPQEQSLATGRLHSRMNSQQNCLQAEKPPGDRKGKSFTWGEGTYPGSPSFPQAENMISGKKYCPEGRILSTACIQRRERRPDRENPGAQRGPPSVNSPRR